MGNVSVEVIENEARQCLNLSYMNSCFWDYSIILGLFKDIFKVRNKTFDSSDLCFSFYCVLKKIRLH